MKFSEYHYGVGKSLPYYPRVAVALKSANACLLLCQLMAWHDDIQGDWFHKSYEEIEYETGLGQSDQVIAREILKNHGMLDESYFSQQKKVYFRLNVNTIDDWLLKNLSHQQTTHEQSPSMEHQGKKEYPVDILFEAFWANYPKQVDRLEAKQEFEKINPTEALLGDMLRAIDCQRLRKRAVDSLPTPAAWLKHESWNIPSNIPSNAQQASVTPIAEGGEYSSHDNFSYAFNEKLKEEYRALYQKKFGIKLSEPFLDETEKAIQQRLSHMLERQVIQR